MVVVLVMATVIIPVVIVMVVFLKGLAVADVGTIELLKDVILLLRFFKLPSSLMIID